MVLKTIWNCREIDESNVSKACVLAVFETIWNYRKKMITMTVKWCSRAVFRKKWNAEKKWKQGRLRVPYDTLWYDIWNCTEMLKAMKLNSAFWRLWSTTFMGTASATPASFIFLMKYRPGPTGGCRTFHGDLSGGCRRCIDCICKNHD